MMRFLILPLNQQVLDVLTDHVVDALRFYHLYMSFPEDFDENSRFVSRCMRSEVACTALCGEASCYSRDNPWLYSFRVFDSDDAVEYFKWYVTFREALDLLVENCAIIVEGQEFMDDS